jgi:hypothetical protein
VEVTHEYHGDSGSLSVQNYTTGYRAAYLIRSIHHVTSFLTTSGLKAAVLLEADLALEKRFPVYRPTQYCRSSRVVKYFRGKGVDQLTEQLCEILHCTVRQTSETLVRNELHRFLHRYPYVSCSRIIADIFGKVSQ